MSLQSEHHLAYEHAAIPTVIAEHGQGSAAFFGQNDGLIHGPQIAHRIVNVAAHALERRRHGAAIWEEEVVVTRGNEQGGMGIQFGQLRLAVKGSPGGAGKREALN